MLAALVKIISFIFLVGIVALVMGSITLLAYLIKFTIDDSDI